MCNLSLPRPEHPRPQMIRPAWQNLNGSWDFIFDFGNSGVERKFYLEENFNRQDIRSILVPFCPESRLSGIGYTDFIPAVWYRRKVKITKGQLSGRVLIHFGAVDYHAKLWVNGRLAGSHSGGYSSFTFDITALLTEGENTLTLWAEDNNRSGHQPRGKQSALYYSHNCEYTRTTGIWQTVWLEFVPQSYIQSYRVYPNIQDASVRIDVKALAPSGTKLTISASFGGEAMGEATATLCSGLASATLMLKELHLWDVGSPNLYDLQLTLEKDSVQGYFGMRSVEIKPDALYLNGRPFFMRTVLDQGFNPEGIYTAPSDDFLRRDLELSMEAGFNGGRLHQRVFEERTLYWADKLGYIVWGEYANGNIQYDGRGIGDFLPEWMEVLERDFNHPALIGWCINNESYWMKDVDDINQRTIFDVTKRLDPTRPVIDASGGIHFVTDMYDVHDYTQDPQKLKGYLDKMLEDPSYVHNPLHQRSLTRNIYEGQPYWISEYGGIHWGDPNSFIYGVAPKTVEEYISRYEGLTQVLLENKRICGFCYTQLTDIEQERNGIYNYDRSPKFPPEVYARIRKANTAPAAIEE